MSLQSVATDPPLQGTCLVEPPGVFDVAPGGEQLVRLKLLLPSQTARATADFRGCFANLLLEKKEANFRDRIVVDQQVSEPNWDELISDPPYGLNPVKRPERLYGREQALRSLMLAAMSGASKFVWVRSASEKHLSCRCLAPSCPREPIPRGCCSGWEK